MKFVNYKELWRKRCCGPLVLLLTCALFTEIVCSQEWYSNNRRMGAFVRSQPMLVVTKDNEGAAVKGGDSPLTVRDSDLLVVAELKEGVRVERFLSYPMKEGAKLSVQVVDKPSISCRWETKRRFSDIGYETPKGNMTLKMSEYFVASEGPYKGYFLCLSEDGPLVLRKDALNAVIRNAEYQDRWDGK